jgi:hypothetical protein
MVVGALNLFARVPAAAGGQFAAAGASRGFQVEYVCMK